MKKITLSIAVLAAFTLANNAFGQQAMELQHEPVYRGTKPYDVEVKKAYVPLYVISDKELPGYFISGKIPESFPKYDGNLKKGRNQRIAAEWYSIPENRALLTEDAKKHFDAKIKELQAKKGK